MGHDSIGWDLLNRDSFVWHRVTELVDNGACDSPVVSYHTPLSTSCHTIRHYQRHVIPYPIINVMSHHTPLSTSCHTIPHCQSHVTSIVNSSCDIVWHDLLIMGYVTLQSCHTIPPYSLHVTPIVNFSCEGFIMWHVSLIIGYMTPPRLTWRINFGRISPIRS